jgi:Predicted Permease Membrane Region
VAWLGDFLHRYPDLAVYLAVGLGYLIGGIKVKGFGLGPVTGALAAGLLIGQLGHVPVSATAKSTLFLLFIFGSATPSGLSSCARSRGTAGARPSLPSSSRRSVSAPRTWSPAT